MEIFIDVLLETLLDSAKLLPVLFLTYLLMEAVEHYAGERTFHFIRRSHAVGPLVGGLLGVIPQCGIAGGAANLFAARVITAGTFIAVIMATSDEMLPLLISSGAGSVIFVIIGFKLVYAVIVGFAADIAVRVVAAMRGRKAGTDVRKPIDVDPDICGVCVREGCACGHDHGHDDDDDDDDDGHDHEHGHGHSHGIWLPALKHTVRVGLMVFAVSLLLGLCFEYFGADAVKSLPINRPVIGELIAGIVGLVPNCSVSVVMTNLYVEGVIGIGPLMSGLLVNGGIGLLVLYRMNRGRGALGRNLALTCAILVSGILGGLLATLLPIF